MSSSRRVFLATLLFAVGALVAAPFFGPDIDWDASRDVSIFWQLRVPRALLGFLAGAGLALAGVVLQALLRNPLATPFTLGVSSGASLGVVLALWFGLSATFARPLVGMAGAIAVMILVSLC